MLGLQSSSVIAKCIVWRMKDHFTSTAPAAAQVRCT
jgi:hypothetical protein